MLAMDIIVFSIAYCMLFGCAIVQGAPRSRCVIDGDMRVPVGFTWRSQMCGSCECTSGGVISCPENRRCEDQSNLMECVYEGEYLNVGQVVTHADGCNSCTCNYGGHVNCSSKACSCTYQGQTIPLGTVIRANDSCNSCQCTVEGTLHCTNHTCNSDICVFGNKTYTPGEEFPRGDGCNYCTCGAEKRITCTEERCHVYQCNHQGVDYPAGVEFPKGDGCNNCICEIDGSVICSRNICVLPESPPAGPTSLPSPDPTLQTENNRTNGQKNKSCKYEQRLYGVGEKMWTSWGVSSCKLCTCILKSSLNQQEVDWDCAETLCGLIERVKDVEKMKNMGGGSNSRYYSSSWRPFTIASIITWMSSWFR